MAMEKTCEHSGSAGLFSVMSCLSRIKMDYAACGHPSRKGTDPSAFPVDGELQCPTRPKSRLRRPRLGSTCTTTGWL